MKLPAEDLRKLADLLDQVVDKAAAERDAWFAALDDDSARLAPTLRGVLDGTVTLETVDLVARRAGGAGEPTPARHAYAAGDAVGPYRLLGEIGTGGMGAVWLAERSDGAYERRVALKLPHASMGRGLAERFARERHILAGLEHPHIARLYDAGVDAHGSPYLALEYVEGLPIDRYCDEHALSVRERLGLVLQVARAVAYAHSRLVVHRDLKPSNILVTAGGEVRLLDFGIAKLVAGDESDATQLTRLVGRPLTPDYASPEQVQGAPIGTASDVYSLGVVAYELLTGAKPYRLKRRSTAELEEAILTADPIPASQAADDPARKRLLRGDLDAILGQAMRKAPGDRYASVDAFAQDIERHLRGDPVHARPDSAAYRLRKFVARNRVGVGAAAIVTVALVAGAGVAWWQANEARAQAAVAHQQADVAKKEAQRARAVEGFMVDLFRTNSHQQADPLKAQQTTARQLLDIGAARVNEALKDAPESRMQMLNTLADMYVQLGLTQQAMDLQRSSIDVARIVHGPDDPKRADALLGYVAVLNETPRRSETPALLAEAAAALDAAGDRTSFVRAALLLETARYNRYEALPAARASADAAVAFFVAHHPERASLVTAYRLAGIARLQAGRYGEAEASFRSAVDTAARRGASGPAWRVGAIAELAEAQLPQMKVDDAEASLRQALADTMKVNGPAHPETLMTQLKVANLLIVTGRTSEGLAMQAAVREAIERNPARFRERWRANATELLNATTLARGRPDLLAPIIEEDVAGLRAALPNSGVRVRRELQLAEVWTALGRYADAAAQLDRVAAEWTRYTGGEAPAAASNPITLARVRWSLAQGRADEALALLDRAYVAQDAAAADAIGASIERARALRMRGDAAAAIGAANAALAELHARSPTYTLPQLEAGALQALGEAQARAGERRAAEANLARALELRREHDDPASVWRRSVQAALDEARGDRTATRAVR
ncbi:MAG: serine/threonine-protein kinase [Burkholderiales bacterium]